MSRIPVTSSERSIHGDRPFGRGAQLQKKPDAECAKNVSPIRRGFYLIGAARTNPTPFTLPLPADNPHYCTPPRSGFLIRGDNSAGSASHGCIILSKGTRQTISESNDKRLFVVRTLSSCGALRAVGNHDVRLQATNFSRRVGASCSRPLVTNAAAPYASALVSRRSSGRPAHRWHTKPSTTRADRYRVKSAGR